jgi:hypothetical protein
MYMKKNIPGLLVRALLLVGDIELGWSCFGPAIVVTVVAVVARRRGVVLVYK